MKENIKHSIEGYYIKYFELNFKIFPLKELTEKGYRLLCLAYKNVHSNEGIIEKMKKNFINFKIFRRKTPVAYTN